MAPPSPLVKNKLIEYTVVLIAVTYCYYDLIYPELFKPGPRKEPFTEEEVEEAFKQRKESRRRLKEGYKNEDFEYHFKPSGITLFGKPISSYFSFKSSSEN